MTVKNSHPLDARVIPNEVLASGRYLDSWVVIFFPKNSNVLQMTSNISNKEIAIDIAKNYDKAGHIVIRVEEAQKLWDASWREV